MGHLDLNTVEEMTRAIESMEQVIRQLKTDLSLIKQLAGYDEAPSGTSVPYKHRKSRRAALARTVPN